MHNNSLLDYSIVSCHIFYFFNTHFRLKANFMNKIFVIIMEKILTKQNVTDFPGNRNLYILLKFHLPIFLLRGNCFYI